MTKFDPAKPVPTGRTAGAGGGAEGALRGARGHSGLGAVLRAEDAATGGEKQCK